MAAIHEETDTVLSDSVLAVCQWSIYAVVCQAIDLFGVTTNIINIIVFVKDGFKDSVNVSLLGLAISDLCCLLTLVWPNICFAPFFSTLDLPFDGVEVSYLVGGWPHVTFTRITGWITALITLERCLCITMPLKVKSILTSKRVSIVISTVFILLIFSVAPVYVVNRLDTKYFPHTNKSLIGLVFTDDREHVESLSYIINNACIPFCAFVVIIVCTVVLVVQLRRKAKWREIFTSSKQANAISSRSTKVAKMVVTISSIFIACFVPIIIAFVAMSLEPALSISGKYRGLLTIIAGFCLLLESINSSVNIFIYYQMSSRYRRVFRVMFCKESYLQE